MNQLFFVIRCVVRIFLLCQRRFTQVTPMMLILIKATLSLLDSSSQALTHPCKQTTMSKSLIIFFWVSVLAFMCVLGLDSETLTLVQINHKSTFFIKSLIQQYSFMPRTNPYACLKHMFWGRCFFFPLENGKLWFLLLLWWPPMHAFDYHNKAVRDIWKLLPMGN